MNQLIRLHSLDNLRAIMMWLGIVLHVSLNHVVGPAPTQWHDKQSTLAADLLIAFIHSFRMPVFFILAGFFVAMLIERRGPAGMLKNRLRRLALPFVIFWPVLFVLTVLLIMLFMHQMVRGTWGLDPALVPPPPDGAILNTMHLWFLYLLVWFCVLTALLSRITNYLPNGLAQFVGDSLYRLGANWWGVVILALPLAVFGASFRAGIVMPGGSFAPPLAEWFHNGLFFAFGLAFYRYRGALLPRFVKAWPVYAATGGLFFIAWLVLFQLLQSQSISIPQPQFWQAFLYNCATWAWSFALIGAFARYLPTQNKYLQYMADSSYWVYLIHMLGTIGFGAMLCNLAWPALLKMGVNMAATTLLGLLSYQLLVRHTPIGALLNGRRTAV